MHLKIKNIMKISFLMFLLIIISSAHAEEYLCVADMSVGFKFKYETKSWEKTDFEVNKSKYLVRKSKLFPKYAYEVEKVGDVLTQVSCKNDFNEYGYLICDDFWGVIEFRFNKNNGRFMLIDTFMGYTSVLPSINGITDEKSSGQHMEIGKCTIKKEIGIKGLFD